MDSPTIKVTSEDFEGRWYRLTEELQNCLPVLGQYQYQKATLERQLAVVNSQINELIKQIDELSIVTTNMSKTIDIWQSEGKYNNLSKDESPLPPVANPKQPV